MNLNSYIQYLQEPEQHLALITSVHRGRYTVTVLEKEVMLSEEVNWRELQEMTACLKGREYYNENEQAFPTVGDYVLVDNVEWGEARILATLPRHSFFARRDPYYAYPTEQAVAANFDYVFILSSMNKDFNVKRLERYLTAAWQSGGKPVIVLSKIDLVEESERQEYILQAQKIAGNVPVCPVSSVTLEGYEALMPYLHPGNVIVCLGSSGVGKSSLVNALQQDAPSLYMKVSGIREKDSRGHHTTTHRQIIPLACGAIMIDTPGMRVLGLMNAEEGIHQSFSDVEQWIASCRFRDCRHENEPGCGVKAAIERGDLSLSRWNSYLGLHQEAKTRKVSSGVGKGRSIGKEGKPSTHNKSERKKNKVQLRNWEEME